MVVEGVVVARREPASLIRIRSTLASVAPYRWRARLMADVIATSEAPGVLDQLKNALFDGRRGRLFPLDGLVGPLYEAVKSPAF